jgi:hypothetical protein
MMPIRGIFAGRCARAELTDVERQYLHKRIAEERRSLSTLGIGAATEATDQEADAERNGGGREGAFLD